jgi:hypothetical protein
VQFEGNRSRPASTTDTQIQARDAIDRALNADPADPTHVVALNLLPRTPAWLQSINAMPMYLGLDLRGGVHFLLQVDMPGALDKRAEVLASDMRWPCARTCATRHPARGPDHRAAVPRRPDPAGRAASCSKSSSPISFGG